MGRVSQTTHSKEMVVEPSWSTRLIEGLQLTKLTWDRFDESMKRFGELLSEDLLCRLSETGRSREEYIRAIRFGAFQIDKDLKGIWQGEPLTTCDMRPVLTSIAQQVHAIEGRSDSDILKDATYLLFQGKLPIADFYYLSVKSDFVTLRSRRFSRGFSRE